MVEHSSQVQVWLKQFQEGDRSTARDMLLKLNFVSRDTYAEWLKSELLSFKSAPCGVYAVRKFDDTRHSIWDVTGECVTRPSSSLGSEDFVHSVIANVMKSKPKHIFDHPGLPTLKEKRVRNILLLDDSIGSGQRIAAFISLMMANKTFRSWWSFGWLRLHIIAFARTTEAEKRILESMPGSDHHVRKFRKTQKVHFHGVFTHDGSIWWKRWGDQASRIYELCKAQKDIPETFRLGFGETMANIVFYHSVPDTIPGVFWHKSKRWSPLFPERSLPTWLPALIDTPRHNERPTGDVELSDHLLAVLQLAKKGLRSVSSVALAIGYDLVITQGLIRRATAYGLLTANGRLTEAGYRVLLRARRTAANSFDRSLYVPKFSCVGWATVQPSGSSRQRRPVQTDSADGMPSADGEAGQASLERTDARTAPPSLNVMPQKPSATRKGHDVHGPRDPKVK